jgi:SAM-dependent methyltransferase
VSLHNRDFANLHGDIKRYYSTKVQTHGACALGVDWPCTPSQELRFVQLLKLCDPQQPFSLNDFGCGYGAMRGFLDKRYGAIEIDYQGVDISPDMVRNAQHLWGHRPHTSFVVGSVLTRMADYSVASGVFNVKLRQPVSMWTRFVKQTLNMLSQTSRRGFAVNFLVPAVGNQAIVEELYTTTDGLWRAHCERTLGRRTQILSNYGLREFTLLARDKT